MTQTAADVEVTRINLLAGCTDPACLKMAGELGFQLEAYRRGAAVMPVDHPSGGTFRRRAARAERLGYRFGYVIRSLYEDDIYRINTSASSRQGRPMSAGYLDRPRYGPEPLHCPRHHVYTYGVLTGNDRLVAYLWLYRSGELAMVSSILGHADRLDDGIMYLLFRGTLESQQPLGGTVFYNLWDSGTDGLRFYKERVGLHRGDVEWFLT